MCGDYDSVIGMTKDNAALRFWRKMPGERLGRPKVKPPCAEFSWKRTTQPGLALRIEPVRIGGRLARAMPRDAE